MACRNLLLCLLAFAVASCTGRDEEAPVAVAFIAEQSELLTPGLRISSAGQQVRAATAEGLVALDQGGNVVPAVAERWIVLDDGGSYIFRLRDSDWPDGRRLTAPSVRDALQRTIAELDGTSLGLDLAQIEEVKAMAGRVIEIRLSAPSPDFLLLLAQPELGLRQGGEGMGPLKVNMSEGAVSLAAVPPAERGLPQMEDWQRGYRDLAITAMTAQEATDAFANASVDVVLGGRLSTLPLADTGPLSRGTVRVDAGFGLFGLLILNEEGLLADSANREALSMAIDRSELVAPFNIGGWSPSTRIVPAGLPTETGSIAARWDGLDIEERRAIAARRVAAWEASSGAAARLILELPSGPGSDLLFQQLQSAFGAIGVDAARAERGVKADIALKDRIARYADAMWYLNQFNCRLLSGPCSRDADDLVTSARSSADPAQRRALLAQAESLLMEQQVFIPFGNPLRWSLVRGDIQGFAENGWAVHSLYALAQRPI